MPVPALRKLFLWVFMLIPGLWWVDLQMDGVRRGTLADQPPDRFPHPGSVVAANFTSPIDPLYLAAVFDPIFVIAYPGSRAVRHVSLFHAVLHALSPIRFDPPKSTSSFFGRTDLATLLKTYPNRIIAVFPECSTTNGKGILPPSPCLLDIPSRTHIFPVSIRYTPADVTTPVPGRWISFLWNLLSQTTICIRVRIAESIHNDSPRDSPGGPVATISPDERRILDKVGEALARLGRSKRVGLTLKDKDMFVKAWKNRS